MYSFCVPGSLLRRFGTGCEALGVHRVAPTFDMVSDTRSRLFRGLQRIPISAICRIFDILYLCHYIKNTKRCHRFCMSRQTVLCGPQVNRATAEKANAVCLSPPARLVQHLVSCDSNKKMWYIYTTGCVLGTGSDK